jgi:hypothetical protein
LSCRHFRGPAAGEAPGRSIGRAQRVIVAMGGTITDIDKYLEQVGNINTAYQ